MWGQQCNTITKPCLTIHMPVTAVEDDTILIQNSWSVGKLSSYMCKQWISRSLSNFWTSLGTRWLCVWFVNNTLDEVCWQTDELTNCVHGNYLYKCIYHVFNPHICLVCYTTCISHIHNLYFVQVLFILTAYTSSPCGPSSTWLFSSGQLFALSTTNPSGMQDVWNTCTQQWL